MRIGIIDLGTNTFNLLIADVQGFSWHPVFKIKEGVKLGQGGINKGYIAEEAFLRGIDAMERHSERLKSFYADKVFAFGTSALRDAHNGPDFMKEINQRFDIAVHLIPGEKEAELIYLGVRQAIPEQSGTYMILDIGGGSNEFIIANKEGLLWKQSFKLGMARLLDKFNPSDPITVEEIESVKLYLNEELQSLFDAFDKFKPQLLVGASGSFDSMVSMLQPGVYPNDDKLLPSREIPMPDFNRLYSKIIRSTKEERDKMEGLEPVRRDMIVLAVIFIDFIIQKFRFSRLYQSSYALKEGALWEVIQNNYI